MNNMFPRRQSVTRLASGAFVLTLLGFVWLGSSRNGSDDVTVYERESRFALESKETQNRIPDDTRSNTALHSDLNKTQTHHHTHSNETLEKMFNNMTLHHINKSEIRDIMLKMNQSAVKPQMDSSLRPCADNQCLNPHPFKYLINTETVCAHKDIFLISYIHTAPSHYKRRMVIRETWGNPKYYSDVTIRVVFVMGKTFDKPEVQSSLEYEAEQYGDIVQEDFLDSYKNLTYKGIGALKWISTYCPHAKYVLKADDDIFVNTFTLLRHLKSLQETGVDNTSLILCLVWNKMVVMRTGKWKVSEEEFKDKYYPTYCSGSAYTMSTDVAIAMHKISYNVPFFWVDDFYITGLLPLKHGGFKHKQFMSTYVLDGRKLEEKFTGPQWFTYVFSHVHNLNKIQSVWERLVKLANGEQHLEVKYALPGNLPNEQEIRKEEERKRKEKEEKQKKKKEEEAKKKGL